MKCQICKQQNATAHYVQVVDTDTVLDLFICEKCAEKLMKSKDYFKFQKNVDNTPRFVPNSIPSERSLFCSSCGKTLKKFISNDYHGCNECFASFLPHLGKIKKLFTNAKTTTSINDLKDALHLAVSEERFEDAASIRDQIKKRISSKANS